MSFKRSQHKRNKYHEKTADGMTKGFVMQQIQKQTTEKLSSSKDREYKRNKNWKQWLEH